MKRTLSISLTLALMATAGVYLLKPAADGNTGKPERRLPSHSTQQAQERPKSGPVTAASEDEESLANRLADDTRLPEEERAKRLHELLLRWAKRDLAAATAWLLAAEPGEARDGWMDLLFETLAETQPRQILNYGLALNAAHDADLIPVSTLLSISLKHLTAEEAIRVMDVPKRSESSSTIPFAFHPQMDLKKLGDFIIERSHLPFDDPRRPAIMPCNLAEVWMKRDMGGAHRYAMAMHGVGDGAFKGYELIQFASAYAEMGPPHEAVRLVREIITKQNLRGTLSDMVLTFISQGEKKTQILLQALETMPAEERDGFAEYALVRALPSSDPAGARKRLAALSVYGTPEGRLRDVQRFMSMLKSPVERQEVQRHLRLLGHTAQEVAFLVL